PQAERPRGGARRPLRSTGAVRRLEALHHQGQQALPGHLLVRCVLHPHAHAGPLYVLPGRDGVAGAARPVRFSAWVSILFLMPADAQSSAPRATADNIEIIRLEDQRAETIVSIAPAVGNIAFEMMVKGKNVFWFPFTSVGEFKQKPALCGNPLLAPWANRLDENAFYANGKKFLLNLGLGNIRPDGFGHPIHGLLLFASDWRVTRLESDASSARVISRLDFSRRPEWMAQFPFTHTIEMTYVLRDGALEVATRVENASVESMPLSLAYHPYFQI